MTIQYVMRASYSAGPPNHVYWSVLGSPDYTGIQSGYNPAFLSNITIDYQITVPINNNGNVVPPGAAGGDLSGTFPDPSVVGLNGIPLSLSTHTPHDGYGLITQGGSFVLNGIIPVVNVKNLGAKGDGTTDDSTAFQNAAAYALSSNLSLFVPEATYLINTAPTLDCRLNVLASGAFFTGSGSSQLTSIANGGQPSWFVSDWYVDPVNGSDLNSGTSVGSPVKTFMGGIVARWKTISPTLQQNTNIHLLNSQTAGQERVILKPILVGGINFSIQGTLASFGTSFSPSSVTAKVRGTPGTLLQLHSMPAGTTQGMVIQNTTKNSYALIDSISGGVAVVTQPFASTGLTTITASPTYSEDDTWASSDIYQLFNRPSVNLTLLEPHGGDSNAGLTTPVAWVENVHILDASGTPGNSTFNATPFSTTTVFSSCWIDPYLTCQGTTFVNVIIANCFLNGGGGFRYSSVIGGSSNLGLSFESGPNVDGDHIMHSGGAVRDPYTIFGYVYFDGLLKVVHGGELLIENNLYSGCHVYGPGTLNIESPNAGIQNGSGATWASVLTVASLELDGNTVGSAYVGSGKIVDNILVTSANLDIYNGLYNPTTGSRYSPASFTNLSTPPAWLQTDWYVDPVNGNDLNTGATSGSPVKTIMCGIVTKWGTVSPTLGQTTTIHLLSSQTVGQEFIILKPVMVKGTNFIIDGNAGLHLVATFNLGTVTAKNRTTGVPLSAGGFSAGGLAVGQLVVNNVTGGHAFIQALSGSTATLSQPLSHLSPGEYPHPALDDIWASGQSVSVYTVPKLNIEILDPWIGDTTSALSGFVWVNQVYIPDNGGGVGDSYHFLSMANAITEYQDCVFDPYVVSDFGVLSHDGGALMNCAFNAGGQFISTSVLGGYTNLYPLGLGSLADVDLDHIAGAGLNPFGDRCFVGYCYVPGTFTISLYPGTQLIIDDDLNGTAGAALYGGASLTVTAKSSLLNRSGTNWVTRLLLTGTIKFDNGSTTGTAYAGGRWLTGIPVTAANLDLYGGLQDPPSNSIIAASPNNASVPAVPPSWIQSDWYVDPINGNDSNSGITLGSPVKSVMGGIVEKWGTFEPILYQTTTIHLLNSQTTGSEAIVLNPTLVGNGPSFFIIDGYAGMTQIGTNFNCGTVTAKVRGNPGALLQVAGMPGGSTAGMLIHNVTRGCYALIDSMSGSTATLTQPFDATSLTTPSDLMVPTQINSWATGDLCQVFQLPKLNLKSMQPVGGDASSTDAPMAWIQNIWIPDSSGTIGQSEFNMEPTGTAFIMTNVRCDPFLAILGPNQDVNCGVYNTWIPGGGFGYYADINGGAICTVNTAFGFHLYDLCSIDGDCIIHGGLYIKGWYSIAGTVYLAGVVGPANGYITLIHGNTLILEPAGSLSIQETAIWGPGEINLEQPASVLYNQSGQTWTSVLLNSGVYNDGTTTAGAIIGTASCYNVPITPANLDTWGVLSDLNTGNRFSSDAADSVIPAVPPSWKQASWYVDPVSGSDSNSGLTSGFPVKTIMGGVVGKWGTTKPILSQTTTIYLINSQTVNQESIILEPTIVDGYNFVILGTPTLVSAFTLGTITAKNRSTGQLLKAAGFSAGGLAAGQLVVNNTHSSKAFIQSLSSNVATLTQPLAPLATSNLSTVPASPPAAEVNTWTVGDSVSVYSLPVINLKKITVAGGDTNTSFTGGALWIQNVKIPDSSGVDGDSVLKFGGTDTFPWLVESYVAPYLDLTGPGWNGVGTKYIINCWLNGGAAHANGAIIGGAANTNGVSCYGNCALTADVIVSPNLQVHNGGTAYLGQVYIGSLLECHASNIDVDDSGFNYGNPCVWGPGNLKVEDGGFIHTDSTGGWETAVLLTGTWNLDGSTVASAYLGNGTILDNIAVNAVNVDAYGGLFHPATRSNLSYSQTMGGNYTLRSAAPGTPPYNSTWYGYTDIYWDPAGTNGGNDGYAGNTSGAPLLTWAEIVKRYGSSSPTFNYGQSVTIHMLSAQPTGQDPIFFEPKLSGGGQAILNATSAWSAAGANFTISGTPTGGFGYTGATPSAGGTPMQIASVPAYVVTGVVLQNTTRNSYARVISVAGGTATCTQPQTISSITTTTSATPNPTVDNDWASGDTIEVWTLPKCNLKLWSPKGSDYSSGAVPSSGWVIGVSVPDTSTSGASLLLPDSHAAFIVYAMCHFACRVHATTAGGRGYAMYYVGCTFAQAFNFYGTGDCNVFGSAYYSTSLIGVACGQYYLSNNTVLNCNLSAFQGCNMFIPASGCQTTGGTLTIEYGAQLTMLGSSAIWGTPVLNASVFGTIYANSVTFASSVLSSATHPFTFGSATTGTSYLTGTWTDGVNLTAANLDSNNGLISPRTGARFTNGT